MIEFIKPILVIVLGTTLGGLLGGRILAQSDLVTWAQGCSIVTATLYTYVVGRVIADHLGVDK